MRRAVGLGGIGTTPIGREFTAVNVTVPQTQFAPR